MASQSVVGGTDLVLIRSQICVDCWCACRPLANYLKLLKSIETTGERYLEIPGFTEFFKIVAAKKNCKYSLTSIMHQPLGGCLARLSVSQLVAANLFLRLVI